MNSEIRPEPTVEDGPVDGEHGGLSRRSAVAIGMAGATASTLALQAVPASAEARDRMERGRSEVSFDTGWRFLLGDAPGAEQVGHADGSWRRVDLPHDWSIEDRAARTAAGAAATATGSLLGPRPNPPAADVPVKIGPFDLKGSAGQGSTGYTVGGIGWYRKHFPTPKGERVEVRFDGVFQNSDVWLNGHHLGFHPYGFTAFTYDLTPYLNRRGANVLAVKVNNTGQTSRFYTGSGIYQHTWLTTTDTVRVPFNGLFVTVPVATKQHAQIASTVEAVNLGTSSRRISARVSLLRHGKVVAQHSAGTTRLEAGAQQLFDVSFTLRNPDLWAPHAPALYTARAELLEGSRVIDTVETSVGVRTVTWSEQGLLINGVHTKVRGANLHSAHGPVGSAAFDRAEERDIELLKAAGFNALRTAHNPVPQAKLDACDRLGILVFDEFADTWDKAKKADDYHLYFTEWFERDLTAFVRSDRNHPSVVVWSLGNEIATPADATLGPRMKAIVNKSDPSRKVTQGPGPFATTDDPVFSYIDVMDFHYDNPPRGSGQAATAQSLHALYPQRAVTKSESWPTTIYDDWKLTQQNPWFVGAWVWTGMDYIGESGVGAPQAVKAGQNPLPFASGNYPWFTGFSGDLDLIGQRKPQNYWRSVVYGKSPLEVLVERPADDGLTQSAYLWSYYDELPSWTWDVPSGKVLKVRVYTSGDEVSLNLNGRQIATKALTAADKMTTTFEVPYESGRLTAVTRSRGTIVATKTLATVGAPARLGLSADVRAMPADRGALVHVLVEVHDSAGRLVPDAINEVRFRVEGAAELLAVGSGNPQNVDSFQGDRHHTWHGRGLAVLRATGKRGSTRLTATAEGLHSAYVTIPIR